jgi:hypothetical protein
MLGSSKFRLGAVLATVALAAGVMAAPAGAQNTQQGLVNVAIEDVIVQVPISVAANICDVNVAVLAQVDDDAAACEATANSTATAGPNSNGPPTQQEGLINVLLDDVLVQVPIAVAANICDVNVAVLAEIDDEAEACMATADAAARRGPGQGGGLVVDIPIDITLLDNARSDDGGAGNIVSRGTDLTPLPAGLTTLL